MSKLAGAYAAVRVSKVLENLTPDEKCAVLSFCLSLANDEKVGKATIDQEPANEPA